MLGEVDGNRMRRIYLDGRKMPENPDPSLHGYSVGRWDGDTLVVETTAIVPQAYIAISEAVGIPNNGDMHIVERIRLAAPNVMHDDPHHHRAKRSHRRLEDDEDFSPLSGSALRDNRGPVRAGERRSGQGRARQRRFCLEPARRVRDGSHREIA